MIPCLASQRWAVYGVYNDERGVLERAAFVIRDVDTVGKDWSAMPMFSYCFQGYQEGLRSHPTLCNQKLRVIHNGSNGGAFGRYGYFASTMSLLAGRRA